MVIVASVALSIMISNDLVIPLFVRRLLKNEGSETEDWSALILNIRRAAIFTHPLRRLPLLPGKHQQRTAGLDRADVVRRDRPVRARLLRRPGLARRQCARRRTRHGGRHRRLGLHAALPVACRPRHRHPGPRPVRPRRAASAGAVRHRRRAAQPWRHVEPVDQRSFFRSGLAVARLGAARAHPGGDLRPARRRPDAEPAPLPHGDDRQRPQGHHLALPRGRADRALLPVLRGDRWRGAQRQRPGLDVDDPLLGAAAGERGRLVLGPAYPVLAFPAQRQRIAATPSACSTTRPRRCSTTATCCRSRSTRWSRA